MLIMKFGGTSVKDAAAMQKAAEIVESRRNLQPFVVLSACCGITDKLLELARAAAGENYQLRDSILEEVRSHHLSEAIKILPKGSELFEQCTVKINELCSELQRMIDGISYLKELTLRSQDSVVAFGELLSTTLFYYIALNRGMNAAWSDARKVIATDSNFSKAEPDPERIESNSEIYLIPLIRANKIIITQGFLGADESGRTTTLGRGGSDFSAALFGAALQAEEIEIWTDVAGILSADPRTVPTAQTIEEMSFDEVRELAFFGAKVIHPDTILPAINNCIPVRVLNTYEQTSPGTLIKKTAKGASMNSVVRKENCLLVSLPVEGDGTNCGFSSKIEAMGLKLLSFAGIDGKASALCEGSIADAFKEENFEIREVSALCICGTSSARSITDGTAAGLLSAVSRYEPIAFLAGTSGHSIIAIIEKRNSLSALLAVHQYLLTRLL